MNNVISKKIRHPPPSKNTVFWIHIHILIYFPLGDLGTKFVEFWRYVTNGDTLTRHKRITDLESEDNAPSQLHVNHVSQRSTENEFHEAKVQIVLLNLISHFQSDHSNNDMDDQ